GAAMVEKVAEGVRQAMRDAGIDNTADVHYVQTKTPLLTIEAGRDAASRGTRAHAKTTTPLPRTAAGRAAGSRGKSVACEVHDSMGVSNGTTALGIAV